MTTTSNHTGTTRYLSFELVSDDDDGDPTRPTTASDVWALACIGWEVGYFVLSSISSLMQAQFIYSKPPHANIPDSKPNAGFRIMTAIEDGRPPATRPPNCTDIISGLWSLFEKCWSQDPSERPEAVAICKFLDDNEEKLIAELEK
jgi:serine/threonine protein kinase